MLALIAVLGAFGLALLILALSLQNSQNRGFVIGLAIVSLVVAFALLKPVYEVFWFRRNIFLVKQGIRHEDLLSELRSEFDVTLTQMRPRWRKYFLFDVGSSHAYVVRERDGGGGVTLLLSIRTRYDRRARRAELAVVRNEIRRPKTGVMEPGIYQRSSATPPRERVTGLVPPSQPDDDEIAAFQSVMFPVGTAKSDLADRIEHLMRGLSQPFPPRGDEEVGVAPPPDWQGPRPLPVPTSLEDDSPDRRRGKRGGPFLDPRLRLKR